MACKSLLMKISIFHINIILLTAFGYEVSALDLDKRDIHEFKAIVEVEETIYDPLPANNGAGPLWNYGSPLVVRDGDTVFVSGLETITNLKPLNNCRCLIYKRDKEGWRVTYSDNEGRQREPCPLGIKDTGQLWLSSNPTLTVPNTYGGPSDPQLINVGISGSKSSATILRPSWLENPGFSEHSYRGMAVDRSNAEVFITNIYMYDKTYWSFLDKQGQWRQGVILFPEADYPDKQPTRIRLCYPNIGLRDKAVHYFAVSDIIEPNLEWRQYKYELTNKKSWDYDFRRLFYTWTPDISKSSFAPFIEVASREKSGGHCWNMDLWVTPQTESRDQTVFLLWLEESLDKRLRPKFIPNEIAWTKSLHVCIIRNGKIISTDIIEIAGEGKRGYIPQWGRFHATADGRLFVIYYCSGPNQLLGENRIMEIYRNGGHSDAVWLPLKRPFNTFMLASEQGGSLPSDMIDIVGSVERKPGINYARIRLLTH